MKVLLTLTLFVYLTAYCDARRDNKKVKLRDIEVLTFTKGKYTTGQRTNPIQQLACTGGSATCSYIPNTIQCYNRGFDGQDVQWECKTELKNKYAFKHVEVICEGYDYPEDPYVLVGSCGLEFSMDYTNPDEPRYSSFNPPKPRRSERQHKTEQADNDLTNIAYGFIAVAVVIIVIIYTCLPKSRDVPEPSAPPPPPGFTDGYGHDSYSKRNTYDQYGSSSSNYQQQPRTNAGMGGGGGGGGGMGTGIWSGLMGAGIGYLFGSRNSRRGAHTMGSSYQSGSGYFGTASTSGNSGSSRQNDGESTRTASAFGGTRRR